MSSCKEIVHSYGNSNRKPLETKEKNQPMTGPASLIFYLQFVYGSTKGSTRAGTTMFDNPDKDYASEKVPMEVIGNGDGNDVTPTLSTLAYRPVRPGSLSIAAIIGGNTYYVVDDSNGNLYFRGGADTTININYTNGQFSGNIDWTTKGGAPDADTTLTATYEFDSEGSESIPQVDLLLTSTPVHAQPRKLRSRYSMEAAANLRLVHGIDAEMELSAVLAEELKFSPELPSGEILSDKAA